MCYVSIRCEFECRGLILISQNGHLKTLYVTLDAQQWNDLLNKAIKFNVNCFQSWSIIVGYKGVLRALVSYVSATYKSISLI